MQHNYFDCIISSSLTASGLSTFLFILIHQRENKMKGLSLVALSDAVVTLLTGLVIVISMLKAQNYCHLSHVILRHTIFLLPFMNGMMSSLSWNYQCWKRIEHKKTEFARNNYKIKSILPQHFISSLFLFSLILMTPRKYIVLRDENEPICLPNNMLTHSYEEKCSQENNPTQNDELFNKFLSDLNKSRSEIIYSTKRVNLLNNTSEIVQKIYQLVNQKVRDMSNTINTERREPRGNLTDLKIENYSAVDSDKAKYPKHLDNMRIPNVNPDALEVKTNTLIKHRNSSKINTLKYKSSDIVQNEQSIRKINFEKNNLTNSNLTKIENNLHKNLFQKANNLSDTHVQTAFVNNNNTEYQNQNTSKHFNSSNTEIRPIVLQNKTDFFNGQIMKKNSTIITNREANNKTKTFCYAECALRNEDEKVLLLLLMTCYLITTCGALMLYNKVQIQVMLDSDEHNINRNQVLLKSARWGMILPLVLLSPGFLSLFMDSMLCTAVPKWMPPLSFLATQVHPIIKNLINVHVIKRCIKCKSDGKVHPVTDEAVVKDEAVVEDLSDNEEIKKEKEF